MSEQDNNASPVEPSGEGQETTRERIGALDPVVGHSQFGPHTFRGREDERIAASNAADLERRRAERDATGDKGRGR